MICAMYENCDIKMPGSPCMERAQEAQRRNAMNDCTTAQAHVAENSRSNAKEFHDRGVLCSIKIDITATGVFVQSEFEDLFDSYKQNSHSYSLTKRIFFYLRGMFDNVTQPSDFLHI